MGTLKLRNCSRFQLTYWREVLGARKNYVGAGSEGTYDWKATYTLKVKRTSEQPSGEGKRMAVNQNGTYYAVWTGSRVEILDEAQILGYGVNGDNPHIGTWLAVTTTERLPVKWKLLNSMQNPTASDVKINITSEQGFSSTVSSSSTLRASATLEATVKVGAIFRVKSVTVKGSATVETVHITMNEDTIYATVRHQQDYTVPAGKSLYVWQAYVDVLGHELLLDHVVHSESPAEPTQPIFEAAAADLQVFPV